MHLSSFNPMFSSWAYCDSGCPMWKTHSFMSATIRHDRMSFQSVSSQFVRQSADAFLGSFFKRPPQWKSFKQVFLEHLPDPGENLLTAAMATGLSKCSLNAIFVCAMAELKHCKGSNFARWSSWKCAVWSHLFVTQDSQKDELGSFIIVSMVKKNISNFLQYSNYWWLLVMTMNKELCSFIRIASRVYKFHGFGCSK